MCYKMFTAVFLHSLDNPWLWWVTGYKTKNSSLVCWEIQAILEYFIWLCMFSCLLKSGCLWKCWTGFCFVMTLTCLSQANSYIMVYPCTLTRLQFWSGGVTEVSPVFSKPGGARISDIIRGLLVKVIYSDEYTLQLLGSSLWFLVLTACFVFLNYCSLLLRYHISTLLDDVRWMVSS
jgi:hypothetical protein